MATQIAEIEAEIVLGTSILVSGKQSERIYGDTTF